MSALDSSSTRSCLTRRSSSRLTGLTLLGSALSTRCIRCVTCISSSSSRLVATIRAASRSSSSKGGGGWSGTSNSWSPSSVLSVATAGPGPRARSARIALRLPSPRLLSESLAASRGSTRSCHRRQEGLLGSNSSALSALRIILTPPRLTSSAWSLTVMEGLVLMTDREGSMRRKSRGSRRLRLSRSRRLMYSLLVFPALSTLNTS
mmetsp:Transcript_10252/g.30871  ORF Transcript_10252/g.30871 Transcript_10252/m.30871 type:complete len:206 (-) Transcript_10252:786-1403(-)